MKQPEIGELFVGAYLKIRKKCPMIQYNVMDDVEGGQGEIDVVGVNHETNELYVCEVVTHLDGALYSGKHDNKVYDATVEKLGNKFEHDRAFVNRAFPGFDSPVFMLWSPYVAIGKKTAALGKLAEHWPGSGRLDLKINAAYSAAMEELIVKAASETKQRGELFYRVLQLLTHLRGTDSRRLALRLQ